MDEISKDFITIWSRYLLTNSYESIKNKLKLLAECGNVDAISAWYKFNHIGQSDQIDSTVKSLLPTNYKITRAIAGYLRQREEKNIAVCQNKIKEILNYNSKNISTLGCIVKKDIMARFEQNLDEVERLQNSILKNKYVECTLLAIEQAKGDYDNKGDIVALGVMSELLEEMAQELPFINQSNKWRREAKKCRVNIVKTSLKNYQTAGTLFNEEQAFTVAKALINIDKKEAKILGQMILNSLANRPFNSFKDIEK